MNILKHFLNYFMKTEFLPRLLKISSESAMESFRIAREMQFKTIRGNSRKSCQIPLKMLETNLSFSG